MRKNKKIGMIVSIIAFFSLLFYFWVTYKYYPGLKTTFSGELDRDISGRVFWDFGDGFNKLDSIAVKLTAGKGGKDQILGPVVVEPALIKSGKSRGYLVWIVLSKHDYSEKAFEIRGKHHWGAWIDIKKGKRGRQLALYPGAKIIFVCNQSSFNLMFFKAPQAGFAKVSSTRGPERYYDTYGKNPRWELTRITYKNDLKGKIKFIIDPHRYKFLKWLPLPHQKLYGIQFKPDKDALISIRSGQIQKSSIHFRINNAVITNFLGQETVIPNGAKAKQEIIVSNLLGIKQSKFHPILFGAQIVTAAVLSFLVYWIGNLQFLNGKKDFQEIIQTIFIKEQRWFFWIVFMFGLFISMVWLMAEWPGCMTPDSIYVHKETKLLRFTNHHPYIYSFFILGLYNLFDSPITIVLFQITIYNLLAGYLFYYLLKKKLPFYLIVPCIIISTISFPIHLYNLTMWKDIPYSLIILFWAFYLTKCYYQRRYETEDTDIHLRDVIILSALFLAVCTFRHNGIVYLLYIPTMLVFTGVTRKRRLIQFVGISTLLFTTYFFILPEYIVYKKYRNDNFFNKKIEDTVREASQVTKNDYYLEDYLSYRVKRFFATLGVSPKTTTWFNDMHHPPQRWFSVDEARSEMKVRPKFIVFSKLIRKALDTRNFRGYTRGRFIFWNSLFPLIGFFIIFFLYKWLPVSALYSSVFLYQTVFMFFVVWPRWRYLYYIYLGGAFLLPVVILEIVTIKNIRFYELTNQ
jgi:hypothetical protein